MVERRTLVLGLALGGTAVVLGALGSHALFDAETPERRVAAFEIGVRYQMWHGLALLALAAAGERFGGGFARWSFGLGVLLFSGSLYALSLDLLPRVAGPVTPLGGLVLIAGWLGLFGRALGGAREQVEP